MAPFKWSNDVCFLCLSIKNNRDIGLRLKFLHTTVWKQEWSAVRKGGLSLWAKTLFSTIVHSTSSSWITTSFFRILMAYSSSVDFISASITCGWWRHNETNYQAFSGCHISSVTVIHDLLYYCLWSWLSPCQSCPSPAGPGSWSRSVGPGPCYLKAGWTAGGLRAWSLSYRGPAWLSVALK